MIKSSKLSSSFTNLGMGSDFVERAEKLGLYKLSDLMHIKLAALKSHSEFTYLWYAEMLNLLKNNDLLSEFQKRTLDV